GYPGAGGGCVLPASHLGLLGLGSRVNTLALEESRPMASKFHHEQMYRGADSLAKLAATRLTLCGAGALGSHLADNLVRQGFGPLRIIDRDRVEEHNVSTQLYGESEAGAWKVEALRHRLFRATG